MNLPQYLYIIKLILLKLFWGVWVIQLALCLFSLMVWGVAIIQMPFYFYYEFGIEAWGIILITSLLAMNLIIGGVIQVRLENS